jgi:dienelactone hydrolase
MKKQEVEFKVGKEVLRGSLFVPDGKGPFPAVVFYHGRGSSRKNYLPIAEKLAQNGIIGLAFDFRGCGISDGEFKKQTHRMGIEDAKAALEFLLRQNVDRQRIGIQGTSFGGYITGMVLKDNDFIKSVVLRAPSAHSMINFISKPTPPDNYFQKRENWKNSGSYKGLEKFRGALLVIESEKDELLSAETVQKYYKVAVNAQKRKLYIQKNVGHSLSDNPEGRKEFNEVTFNWFLETL